MQELRINNQTKAGTILDFTQLNGRKLPQTQQKAIIFDAHPDLGLFGTIVAGPKNTDTKRVGLLKTLHLISYANYLTLHEWIEKCLTAEFMLHHCLITPVVNCMANGLI